MAPFFIGIISFTTCPVICFYWLFWVGVAIILAKEKRNETVTNCDQLKTIAQDRQTGSNWSQCEKLKKDNKITAILSNTLLL